MTGQRYYICTEAYIRLFPSVSVKNTQFEVDSGEHPPGFIRPQDALGLFLSFNKNTVLLVGEVW